jgi:hypothetical protein
MLVPDMGASGKDQILNWPGGKVSSDPTKMSINFLTRGNAGAGHRCIWKGSNSQLAKGKVSSDPTNMSINFLTRGNAGAGHRCIWKGSNSQLPMRTSMAATPQRCRLISLPGGLLVQDTCASGKDQILICPGGKVWQ